ncbi:MAG TPA: hypothetical protein PLP07_11680 [Pyrinomonadaceae bacterium]|nr:hypothetical protein [Chloracidobacterium sp.]MBP9936512.1 hypothetical protein [Pyrinomonadaceae bacterium]HQX56580.1 hypothetical protein [Pyrinomonadaceae bacterium]HQY67229.1 hypothetical protein [Pyrinomonadaceae bacterium]
MWHARTKNELIIEVWEKLDCENVGSTEIEAIEIAVAAEYGQAAVDSPMIIARLLADEGAELRHAEIMRLYVERASNRPYDAAFRNLLDLESLLSARRSILSLNSLRRKYVAANDREGVRLTRQFALDAKRNLKAVIDDPRTDGSIRRMKIEITEWLSLWLQTPNLFNDWVELRQRSPEFRKTFGQIRNSDEQ